MSSPQEGARSADCAPANACPSRIRVRPALPGDEPLLRDLRLQALRDAPRAFGSTYERELARTTADWNRWLTAGVTLLLHVDEQPRGLVAGVWDEQDRSVVHLMAMWTHPDARGTGASDALVTALLEWAQARGARVVRLHVIRENGRARRFYTRLGFSPTGLETPRERYVEVEMERQTGGDDR